MISPVSFASYTISMLYLLFYGSVETPPLGSNSDPRNKYFLTTFNLLIGFCQFYLQNKSHYTVLCSHHHRYHILHLVPIILVCLIQSGADCMPCQHLLANTPPYWLLLIPLKPNFSPWHIRTCIIVSFPFIPPNWSTHPFLPGLLTTKTWQSFFRFLKSTCCELNDHAPYPYSHVPKALWYGLGILEMIMSEDEPLWMGLVLLYMRPQSAFTWTLTR